MSRKTVNIIVTQKVTCLLSASVLQFHYDVTIVDNAIAFTEINDII